eukprot:CAMPEP_0194211754 /NCGR_PEP_ID=MMETSP0156-20130528/11107_1 /TAXON_ID=33649 /ORGANISM="Thalassionema nitzschioides, Strain L26-B" /LENGTH=222 /DNA_ID=CAMNT_0038939407 /DNA_START=38 /DNA_END=706 /DNA_ORIENTATION=-
MTSQPVKNIRVYYWDFPFWRAECVRLGLFIGDVEFEDVRDAKKDDMVNAGKLAFGALPVMEVDGKMLSQTQAMAVYSAKLAGIHPEDPWLAAKVDECINGCTDVTGTVGTTFALSAEEKIESRKNLIAEKGRLRMHLSGLEKLCMENGNCGFAVGECLTMADLAIWRLVGWFSSGTLDGIPTNFILDTFPAISKVVANVDSNEKVQEWKAKHPKFYGNKGKE